MLSILNAVINFVSFTGSAPSFTLCFVSYQAVKDRKLDGSNTCPVSTPDCPSGTSTLIAGETDAPTYGKVLLSIEVALAVFP